MSSTGYFGMTPKRALAYQAESSAAAAASLDSMVLSRLVRVRQVMRSREARLRERIAERGDDFDPRPVVVLIGPCGDRGIFIGAVSIESAKTELGLGHLDLKAPEPGRVLVYAWNHRGNTNLREYPLGE